jgi:hypothetical protein
MKTLTLKIPEIPEAQLNAFARKKGISRSEIVRCALREYISRNEIDISVSFLDLSKDLAGSIEGPFDLSTNKSHLNEYGKAL